MSRPFEEVVQALRDGGLVVYPTETFYALGCLATMHASVERVVTVKGRPADKPLPVIVADWDMAGSFLLLEGTALDLAHRFWPGPLSIVTRTSSALSPLARDGQGRSAVRMSPHPVATRLCREAGAPLVSSSANVSGRSPVCLPADLDPALLCSSGAVVVDAKPWPAGGLPSTLVEIVDNRFVKVLREGAIPAGEITKCGFDVLK